MPPSSGTRSKLTMCEGIGNFVALSCICTTRSVPPANGRALSPCSLSSAIASFRFVGAWYSNARNRPSFQMRASFYNSYQLSAISYQFRRCIIQPSLGGGTSDAFLHQRRTTRAGVPAHGEVARDGGVDVAGDQAAGEQRQGPGRRRYDRSASRLRDRRRRFKRGALGATYAPAGRRLHELGGRATDSCGHGAGVGEVGAPAALAGGDAVALSILRDRPRPWLLLSR